MKCDLTMHIHESYIYHWVYVHWYIFSIVGVAVATAFCAIDSTAITLPTDWPFGVSDTGIMFLIMFQTFT